MDDVPRRPGLDPVLHLATADLTATPLRRRHLVTPEQRDAAYHSGYDRTTLWYDAFWRDGAVTIIAPPLMNLKRPVFGAAITLDGRPARLRRVARFQRYEILRIAAPRPPEEIVLRGRDWALKSGVAHAETERLAGKNVILTISRDNELDWIRDFALFHKKTQGAEAVLFIDNGSGEYAPEAVAELLRSCGLQPLVVTAPLPYGPVLEGARHKHAAKFFRTAMLNVARLRFLPAARAVLNVDIDELVWSEGKSVFDMAAESMIGFAPFAGRWRNPGPDAGQPPSHADHLWRRNILKDCPAKYAVAPGRLAGRLSWDVHRLERLPFKDRFLRKDAGYWHCSGISTGWKYVQRLTRRGGDGIDEHMARRLEDALGPIGRGP